MGVLRVLLGALCVVLVNNELLLAAAKANSTKLSTDISQVIPTIASLEVTHATRSLRGAKAVDETSDEENRGLPIVAVESTTTKLSALQKVKQRLALASLKIKASSYLAKGAPTHEVWALVGLDKMTLEAAKQTKQFKIYEKYVKDYDDLVNYAALHGKNLPRYSAKDAPETEIAARAEIWYNSGKSAHYVKEVLGLRYVPDVKLAQVLGGLLRFRKETT